MTCVPASRKATEIAGGKSISIENRAQSRRRPNGAQAFTIWLCSARFGQHESKLRSLAGSLLEENPFTTLQVVLEPREGTTPEAAHGNKGGEQKRLAT